MSEFYCKGAMYMRNEIAFGVLHIPKNKRPHLCMQVKNNIVPQRIEEVNRILVGIRKLEEKGERNNESH